MISYAQVAYLVESRIEEATSFFFLFLLALIQWLFDDTVFGLGEMFVSSKGWCYMV